jgi:DNA-binding beta-propeller fold protein YncE
VTSSDGIVPFNLTTHRTGHAITVPLWNPNASVIVSVNGRTGFTTNHAGLVPINFATGDVHHPLLTGEFLQGLALSPDGRTLWAPDWNDEAGPPNGRVPQSIVPISTTTWTFGRAIPVPGGPLAINVSADGRTAWATTQGGATLTEVNLPLGGVGYVIPVPEGVDSLAIAPGGTMAYAVGAAVDQVGSYSDSYVTPIDLVTGVAEQPIVLHYDPYGIAISPDGRTAWVTGGTAFSGPGSRTPDLRSIDLATGRVAGTYSIPGGANDVTNATSGG